MRIGTGELLIIFIVALLVLGPEKIPKYAKRAGQFLGSIKVYADKLTDDINEDVVEPLEEIQKTLKDAVEPLSNISDDIKRPIKDIEKSVNNIGNPKKKIEAPSKSDEDESASVNIQKTHTVETDTLN